MFIKALESLTYRDSTTGKLTSLPCNTVADVDSSIGNELITEGLAIEYSEGGGGSDADYLVYANNIASGVDIEWEAV